MMTLTNGRRAGILGVPALLASLCAAPPARARLVWTSGTFVYADLCTLPESGARAGQRITLRRSPNGDGLTYERAEGGGTIAALSLDDATGTVAFAVETEAGTLRFAGIAAADALTGAFADGAGTYPVHLPRVLRSHAHEACPGETTGSVGWRR